MGRGGIQAPSASHCRNDGACRIVPMAFPIAAAANPTPTSRCNTCPFAGCFSLGDTSGPSSVVVIGLLLALSLADLHRLAEPTTCHGDEHCRSHDVATEQHNVDHR